jgi:hypothetical protein
MKKITVLSLLVVLILGVVGITWAQSFPASGTTVSNSIIQNMATGAGENATIVIDYYDQAGNNVYTNSTVVLAPKAVTEVQAQKEPLPSGFVGSAIVSSDRPVGAVTSLRNQNVPGAADGETQGAYNGAPVGKDTIYFPSFWAFQYIVSRFTVQNTENAQATIEIDYFKRDGTKIGTLADSLPAYGSKTYCGCDPADWPGGSIPAGFLDGAITVRSTNGKLLAGASTATRTQEDSAYQALTAGDQGTILYAPSSFRFNLSNPVVQSTPPVLFSAVNIQNTSSTDPAPVTIQYFNRKTGLMDLELHTTILPGSATGANNFNGGDFDYNLFKDLKTNVDGDWDGSVKIISDNDIPLVGTGITQWGGDHKATMYALIPATNSAKALFLPAQYRHDYGTASLQQWSSLNLQNVGSTTISKDDLFIQYIDTNGNTLLTLTGADIFDLAPGAALGANTNNGGDLDKILFNSFGTKFIGGIYVYSTDATAQLVATANIVYTNRASTYNAIAGS